MLRATFCLVLQWLAPNGRGYDGASEVTAPASEPEVAATPGAASDPALTSESVSVQSDAAASSTSGASGKPRAPAAVTSAPPPGTRPATAADAAAPTPKWWGPFPRPKLTGFGGPVVQLTGFDGKFAAMVGLAGGVTIKRRVSIGATAMWLLNPADAGKTSVGAPQRLNVNFGGLLLAVVFARTSRIDFTVGGLLGGGGACLQNPNNGSCYARTAMFVGQPGLAAHIKLAPIVRLSLGLGYRLVAARDWTGPGDRRLGAPVGTVMLELGLF